MVQKGGIGMVEQFMYFWLLWLLVIVVFFFINNDSLQRGSLVTILLIIACTDIAMALDYFIIHMNVLFVIIYGLFFYARTRRPFFTALYTFICALFYCGIRLWEKTTPVLFVIPSFFFIPFCIIILLHFLCTSLSERLAVTFVSVTLGYMMYTFILFSYNVHNELGEYKLFIHLAIIVLVLFMTHLLKRFFTYIRYIYVKIMTEHSL